VAFNLNYIVFAIKASLNTLIKKVSLYKLLVFIKHKQNQTPKIQKKITFLLIHLTNRKIFFIIINVEIVSIM